MTAHPPLPRDAVFVSTDWLERHLRAPDVVILDASWYLPAMNRDPEAEYLAGHIPGAIRFDIDAIRDTRSDLPHMLPEARGFAETVGALGVGDGMRIVVYDGAGLFSAPRVRWTFKVFGASDVMLLDGGLPRWKAEGRPLAEGCEPPRRPELFTARQDMGAVADLADMRRVVATKSAQILDARPADRFRGEAPEPREGVVSGHMPGAFNLPALDLVADGRMPDADGIRAALLRAGVDPERPVITSCGTGVTAAVLSLALELVGHPAKALYDGSWTEWGSRSDCDVATGA